MQSIISLRLENINLFLQAGSPAPKRSPRQNMKTIAVLAIRIVTILGYVAAIPAAEVIKRREERKVENPAVVLCDKCINDCVDNFNEFSCDVQCSTYYYDDDSPVNLRIGVCLGGRTSQTFRHSLVYSAKRDICMPMHGR
jgi:hypothetical protein